MKRHKSGKLRTFVANWKAFRISKTDLKIRPIYHRLQHRIETHIFISFVAYKVYKELERQLKELQSNISPEKAIEIAKTIYQVKANTQNREVSHILLITDEQKNLAQIFSFGWPSVEVRKEYLQTIHNMPMSEQKILLEKNFDVWKGNQEQTDDVILMGVRF